MATILQTEEEDDKKGPLQTSGELTSSSIAAPSAPAQARPEGSGRAVNLKQYVEANKPQSGQIAQGIGQQAEKEASGIRAGIQSQKGQFEQQAGQLEQNLGEGAQPLIQSAFQDPQALLNQQQQLEQFQNLRTGGYGEQIGQLPANTQELQQQVQGLQQSADLSGGEAGRFGLLQKAFGTPTYSSGQQRLDQLLLQATPGVGRELQTQLSGIAQGVGQDLGAFGEQASARQQALSDLSSQRQQEIGSLLQTGNVEGYDPLQETELGQLGLQDIEAMVGQRATDQQASAGEESAALRGRLSDLSLTAQDLQDLGLEEGQNLYGMQDLSPFITQSELQATNAGVIQDPEFARLQALQQLSGVEGGFLSQTDPNQIGGFKPYDFRGGDLQTELSRRGDIATQSKSAYDDNIEAILRGYGEGGYTDDGTGRDLLAASADQVNSISGKQDFAKALLGHREGGYDFGNAVDLGRAGQLVVNNASIFGGLTTPQEIESKNALQRLLSGLATGYETFDPTQTLQSVPEDLEGGDNFNV